MYYGVYEKILGKFLDCSAEDYILNNDFTSLFEKYDEKSCFLLRGLEVRTFYLPSIASLKKSGIVKKVMKKVTKDFTRAFFKNPRKYFDSLFVVDSRYRNIFSSFTLFKIDRIMKFLRKEANSILISGPKNSEERHFLMKYLKNNIDLDDEYQRKLIFEILSNDKVPTDMEECSFLSYYVNCWMLRESGYDDIDNLIITTNTPYSKDIGGYAGKNFMCIVALENDMVAELVRRVCHETRHIIQCEDEDAYVDSKAGFYSLEKRVFGNDYYKRNYWFSRIEQDAERVGLDYTLKFLSFFGKEDLARNLFKHDHYLEKEPYEYMATPICSKGGSDFLLDFSEFSRVSEWDSIIKNHSYLLEEYPFMSKLYDEKGEKLSFDEMMENDFSSSDNLELLYDYIFVYIQAGCLDEKEYEGEFFLNNLMLVYEKTIDRLRKMVNLNPSVLKDSSRSDSEDLKYHISDDMINQIFSSEVMYYYSFVTKVSRYLCKHISLLDNSYKNAFIKDVDLLLGNEERLFHNLHFMYKSYNVLDFLKVNYNDLLSIYNELRKDDVLALYSKMFDELVPNKYKNMKFLDSLLNDYVLHVLPLYTSYSDISKIIIDGEERKFDDYILELVSDSILPGVDISEIQILLDLIRKVYDDKDFWANLCLRMTKIIEYYEKEDKDFAHMLSTCFSNARDEHFENEMSGTPISLDVCVFSDEVKEVISKLR